MPYQIPFRLKVLQNLTMLLQGITVANGYQFDLDAEGTVVRGRLFLGNDEPDVMVSILEPPAAIEPGRASVDNVHRKGEWDILVQGWAADDPSLEPCDLAYILAADVQKCLGLEKRKPYGPGQPRGQDLLGMGLDIMDMTIGAPVVRPSEEKLSGFGQFYIILTVKIVEDTARPFE